MVTDEGLQNERTSLAWRRTGLSLVVAAGTMAKVTAAQWHTVAAVWLVIGIPVGLAVLVVSTTTYHERRHDRMSRDPGLAVMGVSIATVALGVLSLVFVAG